MLRPINRLPLAQGVACIPCEIALGHVVMTVIQWRVKQLDPEPLTVLLEGDFAAHCGTFEGVARLHSSPQRPLAAGGKGSVRALCMAGLVARQIGWQISVQ